MKQFHHDICSANQTRNDQLNLSVLPDSDRFSGQLFRSFYTNDFSDWVRPTSEEVVEAMDELNYTLQEWADLIGVKLATISRWRTGKFKIPYAEWATICYLTGLGDIWEREDSIKKIQNKATKAKKILYFI